MDYSGLERTIQNKQPQKSPL